METLRTPGWRRTWYPFGTKRRELPPPPSTRRSICACSREGYAPYQP
jgi:hypothetical protein